jgi:hypothetical protein
MDFMGRALGNAALPKIFSEVYGWLGLDKGWLYAVVVVSVLMQGCVVIGEGGLSSSYLAPTVPLGF